MGQSQEQPTVVSQPTPPFSKRRAQERMRADVERFLASGGRVRQFDPTCREVKEPAIDNRRCGECMNVLSRAQKAYDAMKPEDDLTFLDVREGLDWLDRNAERLVAGQDIIWGGSLGVLHEELIEALEADHDYLEWRDLWLGLLLRNTKDDAADRDDLESDIRKLAYAKAKELLTPWADNYATWARIDPAPKPRLISGRPLMPEHQIVQLDQFMELHQFGGQFYINSVGRWIELGASREEAEQRLEQLQGAVRSLTKGKAA